MVCIYCGESITQVDNWYPGIDNKIWIHNETHAWDCWKDGKQSVACPMEGVTT